MLPLTLLFCCTVQKRKYQKGFYIAGSHEKNKPSATLKPHREHCTAPGKTPFAILQDEIAIVASSGKQDVVATTVIPSIKKLVINEDTCDKIVMRDGLEISAKVLEIGEQEVRYRKCDMPGGPMYVSRKADIFMITYSNGSKEVFNSPVTRAAPPTPVYYPTRADYNSIDKVKSDATLSLIFGLTGLLLYVGSIPAIILGRRVLKEVQQNPGKYKDTEIQGFAKAGVILGIVKMAIVVLAILIGVAVMVMA